MKNESKPHRHMKMGEVIQLSSLMNKTRKELEGMTYLEMIGLLQPQVEFELSPSGVRGICKELGIKCSRESGSGSQSAIFDLTRRVDLLEQEFQQLKESLGA